MSPLDDGLRALNATHLFVIGKIDIELEEGLPVIEQGRLNEDPVMKTPLTEPRLLYEIRDIN